MHVIIDTKQLQKALARVGLATDSRTLPILGNVLISATKGHVTLSATNLDIFITEMFDAEVKEPGVIAVAYRLLNQFIARATAKKTTLILDKKILVVTHAENIGNLETLPADEFPPNLAVDKAQVIECEDAKEVAEPLRLVAHAMSWDESRYVLNGVALQSVNKLCEFVATDGKRMAIYKSGMAAEKVSIIIPRMAVTAITKLLDTGAATLKISPDSISIANKNTEIRSKLIEGNFPNYNQVIPDKTKDCFSAKREELIEAVTTAALFLEKKDIGIFLAGKGKELQVGCEKRFSTKLLGTELNGQSKLTRRLNFQFLLEPLRVIESEDVRIEVLDEHAPMVLRDGGLMSVIQGLSMAK